MMPKLHGLRVFIPRPPCAATGESAFLFCGCGRWPRFSWMACVFHPSALAARIPHLSFRIPYPASRFPHLVSCLSLLFLTGCASIPFKDVPRTAPGTNSALTVRAAFARTQDSNYEALQSVVFQLFGRKMTGLGYFSVDTDTSAFALSCMTPMGMKLFDIQGQGDTVEAVFALPQFGKKENLARAVGLDLKRTYFDILPPEKAEIRWKKDRLVFIEHQTDGRTEYDFGGPDQLLLEKRVYAGRKMVCRIRYYEYEPQNGFLYPHGIILENRNYHYRLILRLKSVYPAPSK